MLFDDHTFNIKSFNNAEKIVTFLFSGFRDAPGICILFLEKNRFRL